jgi:hypothetical protein
VPPSSGSKGKSSKKQMAVGAELIACFLLVTCSVSSLSLKMEAVYSSETSVNVY